MPTFFPISASNPMNNLPNRSQSAYFKTRLCTRFMSGLCPKGSNCNFAHNIDELRARNAHLKRTFSGTCNRNFFFCMNRQFDSLKYSCLSFLLEAYKK
ncbi:hypothetical protein KSP39_PZI007333 [Platanthera zijinensis]|uniref:C3H1-type domain-containing protein n=1 Tax=Platanthera zijinensis TaxID=2320716 RepID=A0AAP0G9N4_9ASPA